MQWTLPDDGNFLAGLLAQITYAAALCAFPISVVLLRVYRSRVIAAMRFRASLEVPSLPLTGSVGGISDPLYGDLQLVEVESGLEAFEEKAEAAELYATAQRRAWRTAGIYGAAGLGFAIVMAVSYISRAGTAVYLMPMLVVTGHLAWPALLAITLVAAGSFVEKMRLAAAYFGVLILLGIVALTRSDILSTGELVLLWLVLNVPGTLLIALCISRPVRAVGPLVLAFLLVATSGATVALLITPGTTEIRRMLGEVGASLHLGAPVLVLGMLLAGLISLSPLGYASGRWIGSLYGRKRISDQSVTLDAVWILFAVTHTIILVAGGGAISLISGVLAFMVYKIVALAGFRSLRQRHISADAAPRLLVLRAFSLGKRSESLFNALAMKWRHIGTMQLICGPDLARTTVEPHEFLDFLHGRMSRRFIDGAEALDQRIAEMDVDPDPDGRFRVNEFFCYDDMWRSVFTRLLTVSDAVLIDLRRFSRRHTGLAFEIHELIRSAPLERVIVMIDEDTELGYLQQLAREAWRFRDGSLRDSETTELKLIRVLHSGDYLNVLRVLSSAAKHGTDPLPSLSNWRQPA